MRKLLFVLFFLVLVGSIVWILRKEKRAEAPSVSSEVLQTNSQLNADIVTELEKLLSEKYNKNKDGVKVTITNQQGDFIVGTVTIVNEGGGRLLAAKLMGMWKIVSDGNGIVTCDVVDLVKFPASLQPGCWNTKTNQIEDRTQRPGMTLQQ
jgi:hypothetical protein